MKWAPLFVLAAMVGLAGCSSTKFSEHATSAGKSNVLRYPIKELTKLDPAMVQDGDTIDVIQQVYEGLVGWSTDSKVEPRLAESMPTVSTDGTVYTFKIRKGVTFSNGRALTADDFKYSIERAADPKLASPTTATYLGPILGVTEKLAGKATEVRGVKVLDPMTLEITIDKPRPYFLGDLTYPASWAVCKEAAGAGEITTPEQMVGTGPFTAAEYVPNTKITLSANKTYWGGAPKIDGIERPIVKDQLTSLNMFKTGQVDLTRVERDDIVGINADPKLKDCLKYFDRPALYYVGLNCKTYVPFQDRRVRQAFAMAIDANEIVHDTLDGVNQVAHSILPPSVAGYRPDAKYIVTNVAAAQKLLASAGYPGGKGMPPLTITFRDGQGDVQAVAERVITQLRQNLGLTIATQKLPWTTYLDIHTKNKLDFFHMRWSADYLDPQNFLSTLLSTTGAENHNNYSNPNFDALCAQADVMVNDDKRRMGLYAQAEDIVLQDAVFIPIYFEKDAELISPRIKGMRESVFGHLPHTTVSLE